LGNFFFAIEFQDAVFGEMKQVLLHIAGVHLACVHREATCEVGFANDRNTVFDDNCTRLRKLAVAGLLCCKVDNDGAWLHGFDHRFGNQDWRALTWYERRCNADISFGDMLGKDFGLLGFVDF
jgi:hypothetical protein